MSSGVARAAGAAAPDTSAHARSSDSASRETGQASVVDGRPLVDFSSNDYLGLAHHPAVAAAMSECARLRGAGSGASHLVTGHGVEHAALEEELADFHRPRARPAVLDGLHGESRRHHRAGRSRRAGSARSLSHASLIDGALLSGARFKRYAHADARRLGPRLTDSPQPTCCAGDRRCVQHGWRRRAARRARAPDAQHIGLARGGRRARDRRARQRTGAARSSNSVWTRRRFRCWSAHSARRSDRSARSSPDPRDLIELLIQKGRAPTSTRRRCRSRLPPRPARRWRCAHGAVAPRARAGADRAIPQRRVRAGIRSPIPDPAADPSL